MGTGSGDETQSVPQITTNNVQARMNHKGGYHFILLLALMAFADAQSQSYPRITVNDLGSTTEFSTEGLVARAIVPPGDTISTVLVRITKELCHIYYHRLLDKKVTENTVALKLVLPGDYRIIANGQTGNGTLRIALEFNYHRNKGGCVYSIPCCVTH